MQSNKVFGIDNIEWQNEVPQEVREQVIEALRHTALHFNHGDIDLEWLSLRLQNIYLIGQINGLQIAQKNLSKSLH